MLSRVPVDPILPRWCRGQVGRELQLPLGMSMKVAMCGGPTGWCSIMN